MAIDPDVWLCAHLLIRRYGNDAQHECRVRTARMIAQHDATGAAVWKRVLAAVCEMQRAARHAGEALH